MYEVGVDEEWMRSREEKEAGEEGNGMLESLAATRWNEGERMCVQRRGSAACLLLSLDRNSFWATLEGLVFSPPPPPPSLSSTRVEAIPSLRR